MFGKAAVMLIIGYSSIFMIYNSNLITTSTRTVDIFSQYYNETVATNAAIAGVNLANSRLYFNPTWNNGFRGLQLNGAVVDVDIAFLPSNRIKITSESRIQTFEKTIEVVIQPSNFAKFGNFYGNLSAIPATGDTFDGPIHVNDFLGYYGSPVFLGKVTSLRGLRRQGPPGGAPEFLGGYESGIDIPLDFNRPNMEAIASSSGYVFQGAGGPNRYIDVDLTFNADGTVTHKSRTGNNHSALGAWGAPVTVPINALSSNGVILIKGGRVTMRGRLNGQATVVATTNGLAQAGNVFIDDDLTYAVDPRVNPASTNMLGIVAENKAEIPFDATRGDIHIHASIFCQNDGLNIDRYANYPSVHSLKLFGGIIAQDIRPTAVYASGQPKKGYRFVHSYDRRLLTQIPPHFPTTESYEVISWFE